MKFIDLFYQGEGVGEISHIELELDATFALLKSRLTEKHQIPVEALLFLEDEDDPIDESVLVKDRATAKGLKIHIHRCRHVEVSVMFNVEKVERRFPPSATCRLICGSFCTFWLSTENPAPVPHIEMYMISAKSSSFCGAVNEQLNAATFVARAAFPANCNNRMDGIAS